MPPPIVEPFGIAASELIHPEVERIESETLFWASRMGLVVDESGLNVMRRSRVAYAAARIAWLAPVNQVALFAQWLVWVFVVDDLQDEAGGEMDAAAVHQGYQRLLDILHGHEVAADALPVERALEDLWARTAESMSPAWRERFIDHMRCQRDAFIAQAGLRRSGRVPSLSEYPQLRRHTNSIFAFDLSEAVFSMEVPPPLLGPWLTLCDAVNDILAWCNDISSLSRDATHGETTNYVTVFQQALSCDLPTAVAAVRERIQQRMRDLSETEQVLREASRQLGVEGHSPDILLLARVLLQSPGAHLSWLLESGRYRKPEWLEAPAASSSPLPG